MRQLAQFEFAQVAGGFGKQTTFLGLAGLTIVVSAAVVMSIPKQPNDIHLYSPEAAYNKGYNDGYWAAYGLHVLLPDLINVVSGSSYNSYDEYY